MRFVVVAVTVVAALAFAGSRAEARYNWYPWCAWLSDDAPAGCIFVSLRQCLATVNGVDGTCYINPYPAPPPRYSTRRRSYYR